MNNDTITINGFDLSEVIRIIEIIRPVGNVRSIATNDAPLLGVNLQEVRTGAKIIKVKFAMQERNGMTLEQAKHTLAGVFNTSEAVRIIISDEPDKYYMGLVAGSVDMDNVTRWFQKGEFELLIPDGVAHSTTYRKFDNGTVQSDKIVFSLINDGNVPAFPIVTVKH
ncbi:phage tail family protein, partial [Streptococcus sp. 19428wC2_LYSM12]